MLIVFSKDIHKFWKLSKNIKLRNDSIIIHSGTPVTHTLLTHLHDFGLDDYIELSFTIKIDKMLFAQQFLTQIHQGMNCVFFQFSPELGIMKHDFLAHDTVSFHGLVIMFIQHNSHDSETDNNETYFITSRYFANKTTVYRDYISVLFNTKGKLIR